MCNTRQKEPLPRAFTMAFGKRNFPVQPGHSYAVYLGFAECLGKGTRQTSKVLPRLLQKHSANVKVLLSVTVTWPSVGHAPTFFCRGRLSTRKSLCRVPDRKHSAKSCLLSDPIPCHVCRGRLTANTLPCAFWALLSAYGTWQSS